MKVTVSYLFSGACDVIRSETSKQITGTGSDRPLLILIPRETGDRRTSAAGTREAESMMAY